ncbi:MAG: hypothetical protein L3J28_09260 [Candidatus Polarisedimenticolaceae bacterium]|nr:hypothetical protein [Candidatus Polarisedimenticolaceae bacterium]
MKRSFLVIAMMLCTLLGTVQAAGNFALTAKAGTLGYGLEGTTNIFSNINARFAYNAYGYSEESNVGGNKIDVDLKLQSATLLLDLHPMSGGFRLSAGIAFNGNQIDLRSQSGGSTVVGDTTYSDISLDGKVEFSPIAPYLGIGWGNAIADDKGWGFNVDLGVLFQGEPDLDLTASGDPVIINSALFQANLKKESDSAEDDLKTFDLYPVFSFGISYKF